MSRIALALALASLLAAMTSTSSDVPQAGQIRVATRLVEIGVIVRDKNGPVSNLTKDDFAVLDRGKPQAISIFSTEDEASSPQPAQPQNQAAAQPLPENTFSDLPQYAAPPRSVTIVLLDNLNTLYGSLAESRYEESPRWLEDMALKNAKNHLLQFIQQLQPQDRVAIYGLTHSLHVICDFTSDRNQLLAILKDYDTRSITNRGLVEPGNHIVDLGGHLSRAAGILKPAGSFENGASMRLADAANQDRGVETMAALQAIAAHVASIPGRKNLVWLTANLPFSGAEMARVLTPANIAVYPIDARGLLAQSPMVLADVPGTADADDVSGASGRMDNMPAQSSQPIGITTMQKLADETGGQAFVNTNDITGAIRKAVEDSAVTYTLGFYINRDALDGKFHEVKVEVHGKGLTIRYPRGYFAYPDTAPTKSEDQLRLLSALQSPLESSVIPLQASLSRVSQPKPDSLSLSCSIDVRNLQLVQSGHLRKGAVVVYVFEQDQTGKVVYQWNKDYNFQFNDAQYAALLKSGMLFHQYLHPKANVTTLRLIVEDPSTSEFGSLIIPLSQVN